MEILRKLVKEEDMPEKHYTCPFDRMIGSIKHIISKTGYTGEDRVEIYLAPGDAPAMWKILMGAGQEEGLIPRGLGTKGALRLEASISLYGYEMGSTTLPKEAGLGIFVKMDKKDFIGKQALMDKSLSTRKRTDSKVTGRGITRRHQAAYADDRQTGIITSGTRCPYLGHPVVMTLVGVGCEESSTILETEMRGQRVAAEAMKLPSYRR